jgi:uncharacterized protein (DUF362 family)
MTVVGLSRQTYLDESVAEAVMLAGGMDFISKDDLILIKPNVNNDKPAPSTVSQEIVRSAIELAFKRKPQKIIVADRSNYNYETLDAMKKTGIFQASIDAGAHVLDFDNGPWIKEYNDNANLWTDGVEVPTFLDKVDKMINLCLCKTHRLAGFSGALSNLIGLISPRDRISYLHRTHEEPYFSERIAELGLFFKSDFTIMDATSVFLDEGPESGTFAHPGIVIASSNPGAADLVGMALLKLLGVKGGLQLSSIWDQPQIKRAVKLGIAPRSPSDIRVAGDISEIKSIRDLIKQYPRAA